MIDPDHKNLAIATSAKKLGGDSHSHKKTNIILLLLLVLVLVIALVVFNFSLVLKQLKTSISIFEVRNDEFENVIGYLSGLDISVHSKFDFQSYNERSFNFFSFDKWKRRNVPINKSRLGQILYNNNKNLIN